jgi:hypothetical protein
MPAPPLPEPELPPPEVGVAPLGVAPPLVGPDAPLEPEPLVPLDVPAVPDEPDELEAGNELAPEAADAPEDDEPPADDEDVVVVVVDVVEPVEGGGWAATVAVGTVSGGAPEVSVAAPVPPHAATPTPSTSPASRPRARRPGRLTSSTTRRSGTTETSGVERLHAPSAVGTIVEILLAELVAPIAEAQVLDRPGQLRRGRGERKELGDHLERLAGVPVDVHPPGLGLDDDFTPGGWRPHPVPLTRPHSEPSYSRARRGVPSGAAGAHR